MTTFNMTCEAVEATLPDYLDETLEAWMRTSIEEHLEECARCTSLARELRNITREAAALPALLPERDVWQRIAGRIGAPVIESRPVEESAPLTPTEPMVLASDASPPISELPVVVSETPVVASETPVLTSEPPVLTIEPPVPLTIEPPVVTGEPPVPASWERRWMGLAAAAVLLVTAGTTFLLTERWLGPARTANVASDKGTRPSAGERPAGLGRGPSAGREQIASNSSTPTPPGQLGSALTVSAISAAEVTPSPEDVVYGKEINTLQRIVRRQKAELDTSTVTEIEKNLRSLDAAIAQIRAALKKDPGSSLLGNQASRALEMKVELLRRTAMLRSST
jgi:hypothetical protein